MAPQSRTVQDAVGDQSRHTAVLSKELGLGDLILAQVLLVVVPDFYGTAVKAGPSHVVLWMIAIALFFIPQALVVDHLNRRLPLEGGLYEWARVAFNDGVGFLVAWNLWLYVLSYAASIGLVTTTYLSYALGPRAEWIAASKISVLLFSVGLIAMLMLLARLGLGVGKWLTNAGSLATVITLAVLVALPFFSLRHGEYHPLRMTAPPLTLFTLSVFSKMTFGALCGFEYVAIFAGESRNQVRNLRRAILITAPVIALFYVLGTSSILAFVPPDAVDVIGPIPQALSRGMASSGMIRIVVPLSILLLLTNYLSVFSLNFAANARLPMVAGWDHLLPEWFTRLHEKYKTPVNSILFLGAVTLAASIGVLFGAGQQEAFEILQILGFTFYGLAYLALFAIPLLAGGDSGLRGGWWVRFAAGSGLLVTALFVLLSALPIIPVQSAAGYSAKVAGSLLIANGVGVAMYRLGRQKREKTLAHPGP